MGCEGEGQEGGHEKRTDGFYLIDNRITPDSYDLHSVKTIQKNYYKIYDTYLDILLAT